MKLRLVVPRDVDDPTGGNVYDLALADALSRDGDDVELVRCDPAVLDEVLQRGFAGPTLVDGLLACPRPEALAGSRASVLVHMPLALGSGLSPDRAVNLDAREREALQAADAVIATSDWSAEYLMRHHGLLAVAVATPGVDPAPVETGSDLPLLVQVAALLPHKNQLGVVAALTALRDLPFRARLVGSVHRDPAYADAIRSAVEAGGLAGRVELPGTLSRDDAWSGADLALLPSLVESYGLVVTEALARGIPAVVSAGGPAEALGVTATGERPGAVIAVGDTDALTSALRRWLTDPDHRAVLRGRALERRSTLVGWDTTAQQVRSALTGR